jgi:hypothetical protein
MRVRFETEIREEAPLARDRSGSRFAALSIPN